MEIPATYNRYERQLILKGFGVEAQEKLLKSKVLVIGVGGLGCPLLQYLVAAGVGSISIIDDDRVSLSNLHRQILFDESELGELKVDIAKAKLSKLNSEVVITAIAKRLTQALAVELFPSFDLVVDASDNFSTRYLVNDACVLMGKPFVFGAVSMYEGQVAVFNKQIDLNTYSTNYRDLFPEQPMADEVLSCEEGGVIGALPGIIGSIQAMEVIKLLAGLGEPLVNRLFTYNALSNQIFITELVKHPGTNKFRPLTISDFILFDYEESCDTNLVNEIDVDEFFIHLNDSLLVDVRELDERPVLSDLNLHNYLNLPLALLQSEIEILNNKKVIFVCQSGKRSLSAAKYLESQNHPAAIYSLKGGVVALNKKITEGA